MRRVCAVAGPWVLRSDARARHAVRVSLTPEDRERRRRAKSVNERLKLFATTINAGGIALVGTAIVTPAVSNSASFWSVDTLLWLAGAGVAHIFAQAVLAWWQSED